MFNNLKELSKEVRKEIVTQVYKSGKLGGHIASYLSIADIMTVLYSNVLFYNKENSFDKKRDRFILSKGHGALAYYIMLEKSGIITKKQLDSFQVNGSLFPGQPSKHIDLGIEFSGGSLGIGLSFGIGLALSKEVVENNAKVFVLMGDGELEEGTIWESAMYAGTKKIKNLISIVDYNQMQLDGFTAEIVEFDINKMWEACGWNVVECDGHDIESLVSAFNVDIKNKPTVIIAKTVKGKGVSFIENSTDWHHNKLTDEQFKDAINELEG